MQNEALVGRRFTYLVSSRWVREHQPHLVTTMDDTTSVNGSQKGPSENFDGRCQAVCLDEFLFAVGRRAFSRFDPRRQLLHFFRGV